ncbi:NAD(P)/FAD-dependent oxidoreductase [Pseudonocardia spinosispora]|uniref:NAD(P)/FAD-dependent oxidoreductase n=1 Tax=Pseudonocardia spinosispora TaxID=103441 RepID=UPI000416A395|nr:FAD-dependent oxidoreductase [Pseudonocardia spinosispora]
MHKIVILGAGYAGLTTTVSLAARTKRRDDVEITLVSASDRFTERLRLHQAGAGQQLADLRIPALLDGSGVRFERGWVTGIDAGAGTVRVDDERVLEYDTLVYALGSVADTTSVPGADEHSHTFDGAHGAELLARRLRELDEQGTGTVVVCGSGLTGVEAAAEIAEQHAGLRVVLVGRQEPGATLGAKAQAYLREALRRLGVEIRLAEIAKVTPDSVDLLGEDAIPADAVLWTSGVRVSPLPSAAGIDTDDRGRILTDSTLRSVSHRGVYAVGDAAAVHQGYGLMHGTCQGGMPTGVHTALSITRELSGRRPKPFRFGYLHAPVSLGRRDAVIQFTHPDDSPKRFCLTGGPAVWYKETVSSAPWPSFQRMRRLPSSGSFAWRRGGRYTR